MSITTKKKNAFNRGCPIMHRNKLGDELSNLQSHLLGSITGTWYYVDKNATLASDSNDGKSWDKPFLTIAQALSTVSDYDGIMIGMGVYSEAGLSVNKEGLKIIGSGTSVIDRTMIKGTALADDHILQILGNRNEIAGICFKQLAAKQCIELGTSGSVDCYNTHIHDCRFYGTEGAASVATYGIAPCQTAPEPDIPDFLFENNWFYGFTTAAIRAHGTRGTCRYNDIIMLSAGDYGIECPQATDGRPYMSVLFNTITGVNSTDIGIVITNDVEPEYLKITGNIVLQCATPMTKARDTEHYVGNTLGVNDSLYKPEKKTWFVDEVGATTNGTGDGKCINSAFLTVAEAVAAAGAYDTIKVLPAVYTEDSDDGLQLNYTGMRLVGVNANGEEYKGQGSCKPECMIKGTDTATLLIIDANDVEVSGMTFKAVDAGIGIQIGDAAETIHNTWIHDCKFIGAPAETATGTYAICPYSPTSWTCDFADAIIERCWFFGWTTAAVVLYGTRSSIKDCEFILLTNGDIGILRPGAADTRPYNFIKDNDFMGVASAIAVSVDSSQTAGDIGIYRNYVLGGMSFEGGTINDNDHVNDFIADSSGGVLADTT